MDRLVWTPREVVDVDGPRASLRNYLEQRAVRELFGSVCRAGGATTACDLGCGFGRMTPVLTEFATHVVGFEREPALLATAQSLQPWAEFRPIESLARLPADTAAFDLALVFTVVQHVPEPHARAVIAELHRVMKPTGFVLLVEETDETLEAGDPSRADLGYTRGRAVDKYVEWMQPWRLLATRRREIEPDYPRPDVGTYMLFAGPSA